MKWLLFLLIFSSKIFSLYMGNPSAPEVVNEGCFFSVENWLAVKAGYQRDWVFERTMKAVSKISGRMDCFSFVSDQGVLTVNVIDRIELYGSAGATHLHAAYCSRSNVLYEYKTHDQLTWGIGLRGIFASFEKVSLGIDGVYQRAHPAMQRITVNGAPVKDSSAARLFYSEWQIGLGISYQQDPFIPYIGVKYANATARFHHLPLGALTTGGHFKVKNRRKFGMVLGTTGSNGKYFGSTVEIRLIDEQSITLAAEVKF